MHPVQTKMGLDKPFDAPLDEVKTPYARASADPNADAELDASMRNDGQLQAVVLSGRGNALSGNRRIASARRLMWKSIKAVQLPDILDDLHELKYLVACDVQTRRHYLDTAKLLDDYRRKHGTTWEQTGKAFSLSAATTSRMKQALDQPEPVLELLRANALPLMGFVLLAKVKPLERRIELAQRAAAEKLGRDEIAKLVRNKKPRAKTITIPVSGMQVVVPVGSDPVTIRDQLKAVLFNAIDKAATLKLGAEELPKIIAGLRA